MALSKTYAINTSRAISETLDGETIIINLESGTYYSMNETGSLVWSYLESGYSLDTIVECLLQQYEATPEIVEKAVLDLIALLEADQLIAQTDAPGIPLPLEEIDIPKKPFVVPVIEKYEDMQEMLLADPIHDVDTAGWPKRKDSN